MLILLSLLYLLVLLLVLLVLRPLFLLTLLLLLLTFHVFSYAFIAYNFISCIVLTHIPIYLTAVSTAPSSGTDRLASITGPARANIFRFCAFLSASVNVSEIGYVS